MHNHISSREVFGINHFKLRNFAVVAIEWFVVFVVFRVFMEQFLKCRMNITTLHLCGNTFQYYWFQRGGGDQTLYFCGRQITWLLITWAVYILAFHHQPILGEGGGAPFARWNLDHIIYFHGTGFYNVIDISVIDIACIVIIKSYPLGKNISYPLSSYSELTS